MAAIDELSVLANVITAARFELSDRDPEDVPKKLSRAAASTGKRIPPPHQRAILAHIEADDGFRDAVRGAFEAEGFDDPVGLAYLSDPTEALPKVRLAVAVGLVAELEEALKAEQGKTAKTGEKLAESQARFDTARQEASKKLAARADSDKRARASLERTARDAQDRADHASEAVVAVERDLATRDGQIADLESKVRKLNEKLTRRKSVPSTRPDTSRSTAVRDPVEIARDLDAQERRLRTFREAHLSNGSPGRELPDMIVPKGLSSSDAAALDAVIAQSPERVIIDGYNVSGLVSPGRFSTREARDDVVNRAAKLVRETDAAVIVVFDAKQSPEGTSEFTSPIGVTVVFEGETIADDAIAAMVHGDSDRCVVITNDREIHNRVRRRNCVSIFSTAFVSWTEHLNTS